MTAGVPAALLHESAKASRFRSVGAGDGGRKAGRSPNPDASLILSQALLDVSRELAQLRQKARGLDVEARHRRLHMYLADCTSHRGQEPGGPGA